jgi:hypothetical protein
MTMHKVNMKVEQYKRQTHFDLPMAYVIEISENQLLLTVPMEIEWS